jgi:hypothetical protein
VGEVPQAPEEMFGRMQKFPSDNARVKETTSTGRVPKRDWGNTSFSHAERAAM